MDIVSNGGTGAALVPNVLGNVPDYGPEGLSYGKKFSKTVRNVNGKKYVYVFNIGLVLDPTKELNPTDGLYFINGVSGAAGGKVSYRTAKDGVGPIPYSFIASYPDGNGGYTPLLLKFKKDSSNVDNGGHSVQDFVSVGSFGYYSNSLADDVSKIVRSDVSNSVRIAGNGPSAVTVSFNENVSPTENIALEFGNGKWKRYSVNAVRDGDTVSYAGSLDFSVAYLSSAGGALSVLSKNDTASLKTVPYREVTRNLLLDYFYKNWLGGDNSAKVGILDIPGGYRLILLRDVVGGKAVMTGVDCKTIGVTDVSFECRTLSYPYASKAAITAYSENLRDNSETYSYYELQSADLPEATLSNTTFTLNGAVFKKTASNSDVTKRVSDRTFYAADGSSYMTSLSSPGTDVSEDYVFINPTSFEGNTLVNVGTSSKYTGVAFIASEIRGANVLSVYGPDNSKDIPTSFSDIPDWTTADGCSTYSASTKKVTYSASCLTGNNSNKVRVDILAGKSRAELDAMFDVMVTTKGGFQADSIFEDKKMKPSEFPMTLNISPSGTASPNASATFVLVSKSDGAKAFSDSVTIRGKTIPWCSALSSDGFLVDRGGDVAVCKDYTNNAGDGFTTFKVNLKELDGKYLREGTIDVCYDNPTDFELQPSSFLGQAQGGAGYDGTYGGGNASDYRYSTTKKTIDGKNWSCHELRLADVFPGTYSDNAMFFILKVKERLYGDSNDLSRKTSIKVIKDFKYYDLPGGYVDLSKTASSYQASDVYQFTNQPIQDQGGKNLYMSMYSVNGQDQPLYSFSSVSDTTASVIKSRAAMDDYSMMRLDYRLPK